jgi:hypothetical protein
VVEDLLPVSQAVRPAQRFGQRVSGRQVGVIHLAQPHAVVGGSCIHGGEGAHVAGLLKGKGLPMLRPFVAAAPARTGVPLQFGSLRCQARPARHSLLRGACLRTHIPRPPSYHLRHSPSAHASHASLQSRTHRSGPISRLSRHKTVLFDGHDGACGPFEVRSAGHAAEPPRNGSFSACGNPFSPQTTSLHMLQ